MNCPECLELLQRRLDRVPIAPDTALEQHLAQCPLCRERHLAARRLLDALQGAPPSVPPAGLASRVVATALRAAVLLMLLAGYLIQPAGDDGKPESTPLVHHNDPPKPAPLPAPPKKEA